MMERSAKEKEPWAKSLFAVTLFVEDLHAAQEFYLRVFDLPLHYQDDVSAVFRFGDTLVNLLAIRAAQELVEPARAAGPGAGPRLVFTIHVDDVDAMCADLVARGVKLLNGPMDRPWGVRTASFVDPGGYVWEIAK